MGGAASKTARTLPKRASPTWAGARTPNASDLPSKLPQRPLEYTPLAGETKSKAIKEDAFDPHFLSNLSRLGPVTVDHHMQSIQPADNATQIYQKRKQAHDAATGHSTPGRLDAWSLVELLDARKSARSPEELQNLARNYNLDLGVLRSLTKSVNSPSVDSNTMTKELGKEGEEIISIKAVWIDQPVFNTDILVGHVLRL